MPTKRLALVIRGAVSLGSYEGGVLYELLRALEYHNSRLPAGSDQRVCIDVLVGASAGSMTAAITTQVLLGARDKLVSARQNPFYQAWVVDVNLAELLRYRPGEYNAGSLLSGQFITELANKHLGTTPTGTPHSAKPPGRWLRFAFALSSLRGLDYDATNNASFPCTRFQDEWCGAIDLTTPAAADWTEIRTAAITSGAFPAAFPVRFLKRKRSDYNETYLSPKDWPASEPTKELPYVDGGVFNNEPLGLAKDLVDLNDNHYDTDRRFYLYVSPSPKLSARKKDFSSHNVPMLDMGGHLLGALIGQAQYQDLTALAKTNRRIVVLDDTAQALATLIGSNAGFAAGLVQTAPTLAAAAFANLKENEETLGAAMERLMGAYAGEPWYQANLPAGPVLAAWAQLLAAFERTASLQHKDTMNLLTICADDSELLGDPLAHFGGFTCQGARHYDYEVGRDKTQRWLREKNPLGLDLTGYNVEPVDLVADRLAGVSALAACAGDAGDQLGDRVAFQSKLLMTRFGIGWLPAQALGWGIGKFAAHYVTAALEKESGTSPPVI